MKRFFYKWLQYSSIYFLISLSFMVIFVYVLGFPSAIEDRDIYKCNNCKPEMEISRMECSGCKYEKEVSFLKITFHEVVSLFRLYLVDSSSFHFAIRFLNFQDSYPLNFLKDYLPSINSTPLLAYFPFVLTNSVVAGLLIHIVNEVAIKYHKLIKAINYLRRKYL